MSEATPHITEHNTATKENCTAKDNTAKGNKAKGNTAEHCAAEDCAANGKSKHDSLVAKVIKFLIPLIVSVGLCVVMFRDIDFYGMVAVIKHECDFRWIALMLALSIIPMVLRGLRWGIQLKALGVRVPAYVLALSFFGTYAVNLVFPRLGEVWRTGYIAYRHKAPFSTVFGSMIADRFADLITVLLLTVATFIVARDPIIDFVRTYPAAYQKLAALVTSPLTWIALVAAIGAVWALLVKCNHPLVAKLRTFVNGLIEGFLAIVNMQGKLRWTLLTIGIWGCYFIQMVVSFHAFPLTEQLLQQHGLIVVLVCFVLTSIAMGIPSNGGIGPYQTTLLFALSLFVGPQLASGALTHDEFLTIGAAFGNVIIASQTVLLIAVGLITFACISIDNRRARHAALQEVTH
jgi:hypothetical protein